MSIYKMLTAEQAMRLSGDDIGFISMDNLKEMNSIDELFSRFRKILLLYLHYKTDTDLIGHFCSIVRKSNSVIFYDSYGLTPDQILLSKSKSERQETDQQQNYLAKLLYNSGLPVEYNSVKLQSMDSKITTCGYWSAIALRYSDIPIDIWEKFWMVQKKSHPSKKLDQLVVDMCKLL